MNQALHVFLKEIREMLRDKRAVQSAVIGPVFLVLVFVFMFGFLISSLKKTEGQKIHVVKVTPEPSLVAALKKEKVRIIEVDSAEKAREMVKAGTAKVVLDFPADFDKRLSQAEPATVGAIFDKDQESSKIALGLVKSQVGELNKGMVSALLQSKGIQGAMAEPINVKENPVKREEGGLGGFLAGLMPYLIVIWAFYGGFSLAADMVAGEKERSTLETLLISPVARSRIALGKFGALGLLCFVSSVSSLIAVVVAGSLRLPMLKELFPTGIQISFVGAFSILMVILPLSAMFAGLLLAISTKARNMRECQSYLTMVSFVVLMPAIFSQFIGFTDFAKAAWVNLVPILNSASVLRSAMLGNFEPQAFFVTLGVNVLLAVLSLRVAVALFGKENVLWRI